METDKLWFATVRLAEVPRSRRSKHARIVASILRQLDDVGQEKAIKVPLEALGDTKANVRAALNRACQKVGRKVATAADAKFLYIWNLNKRKPLRHEMRREKVS